MPDPTRKPIFDTDITKPIPVLVEEVRRKLSNLRGNLSDIGYCLGWKERFEDVMGLMTCGISVLYGIAKEVEESEAKWREEKEKKGELPKSYGVGVRGIGKDMCPGCFVCGGPKDLYSNISMFVSSKETGEAVTALFTTGARLDYRDYEPGWIQIKVGACSTHMPNLELLCRMVAAYPKRITAPLIKEAMELKVETPT